MLPALTAPTAAKEPSDPIYQAIATVLRGMAPTVFDQIAPLLKQLLQHMADGHTSLPLQPSQAQSLIEAMPLVSTHPDRVAPLLWWQGRLCFMRQWHEEAELAHRLLALSAQPIATVVPQEAAMILTALFGQDNLDRQKQAAALALLQSFLLISGGPGTGKTTTVAKIVASLLLVFKRKLTIALAAPTGKAAAHMASAFQKAFSSLQGQLDLVMQDELHEHQASVAGLQGQTLHRLLRLNPITQQARYHAEQPLPYDLIIVDEASMIDSGMMHQLLAAIAPNSRLILLGDKDQLPSVGAGAVIQSLFRATQLTATTATQLKTFLPGHDLAVGASGRLSECILALTHSHRFDAESGIGALARAINQAPEDIEACFQAFPIQLQQLPELVPLYAKVYQAQAAYWQAVERLDLAEAFQQQTAIIVLSALKQDALSFNEGYEAFLAKQGHRQRHEVFYPGKVIMISGNDYPLNLFNGDIGILMADHSGTLKVCFQAAEGFRALPLSMLPAHECAFAFTVHKSQGSEYQSVWLLPPVYDEGGVQALMTKALVYTAVTRARQRFGYVGSLAGLSKAAEARRARDDLLSLLLACP